MDGEAVNDRSDLNAEAAAWVVRLADPACTPADQTAFEAWRAADIRREIAYERELAAWEDLDRLRALRPVGAPDPDLLAPRGRAAMTWFQPRRMAAAIAGAMILVVGAASVVVVGASPAYATAVGERRVVVLKDGSRIELNTNSKIVVRYRRGLRTVELLRGEAMFSVAGDARPFVVEANGQRLKLARGDLAVRVQADAIDVTVQDGDVALAHEDSAQPAGNAPTLLTSGSRAVSGPSAMRVVQAPPEQIERALAWRQGAIALDGQPLGQAVAEFNRYNKARIVIADSSISGIRLAGYFQNNDPRAFVQAVTRAFPVKAQSAPDGSIQLSRAG